MPQAFDIVMRIVNIVFGLLMVLMGAVWMMQGLGVGPSAIMQGFMVNDISWTFYGAVLALVGIAEIIWASKRRTA